MSVTEAGTKRELSAYEWGYLGGRLSKLMEGTIKSALTSEALDAVLSEFRQTLDAGTDTHKSGKDSQYS